VRYAEFLWVLACALIAFWGCESSAGSARQFAEPPIESYSTSKLQVRIGGNIESLNGATISPDFFKAAGVHPLVGRFFADGDYRTQTPSVAVLSHEFWQRYFNAAPQAIGATLTVNEQPLTVIGVAVRGFAFPRGAQVWLPRTER